VSPRGTIRTAFTCSLTFFRVAWRGERDERLSKKKYGVDPPPSWPSHPHTPTFKLVSSTGPDNLRHRRLYTYPALLPTSMIHPEAA